MSEGRHRADRVVEVDAHLGAHEPFVVEQRAVGEYRAVLRETLHTARPSVVIDDDGAAPLTYYMATGWAGLVAHGTAYLDELGAFGAPLTLVRYSLDAMRPLLIGDRVATAVRVVGRARGPAGGSFVTFEHATLPAGGGEPLAHQRSTVVVQGLVTDERDRSALRRTELDKHGEPQRTSMRLPAGLPGAFASSSGDLNPIHLDDEAARAAGFGDVVVHGMCLLALALECLPVTAASGAPASVSCHFGAPALSLIHI